MTREEALKTLIDNAENGYVDIEEVKLVFLELEQEPCEDVISRQAAIDAIKKIHPVDTEYDCTLYDKIDVMYVLKDLPSIKALEQESILDKIRAEVEQLPTKTRTNWDGCCPDIDYPEIEYVDVTKKKLLGIIDKYKTEREEK